MTEEAQRVALAEACGWKECRPARQTEYGFFSAHGIKPMACGSLVEGRLPDYLHSLDAMHEAEKVLTQAQDYDYRATILPSVCGDGSGMLAITATAAQRAEAFLRTLNFWDDMK